jgi:hypothetical protein
MKFVEELKSDHIETLAAQRNLTLLTLVAHFVKTIQGPVLFNAIYQTGLLKDDSTSHGMFVYLFFSFFFLNDCNTLTHHSLSL